MPCDTLDFQAADNAPPPMRIVILGLSITSSWGNGHATTYRGLVRELIRRGHKVLFLEHDKPWYAANRDLPHPPFGRTRLYQDVADLKHRFAPAIKRADAVIVGSFVPEGIAVGQWVTRTARGVTAFYDIDTPVTLAQLRRGQCEYVSPQLIPRYDLYLSFSGGKTLDRLERVYGAARARPLYCGVDPEMYYPEPSVNFGWDLGYLGTYSKDRQRGLEELLIEPARRRKRSRFVVAGPMYPPAIKWAANVARIDHVPPDLHRRFYNRQRFTLNLTRKDMIDAGYSPSVRLFEAAAAGTPIISDWWEGLDSFFIPDQEILIARTASDVVRYLDSGNDLLRAQIARNARAKVLALHTAAHRAAELEQYVIEARDAAPKRKKLRRRTSTRPIRRRGMARA